MLECELKPYCEGNCDQCKYGRELKQRQDAAKAVEALKNEIMELFEPIFDFLLCLVKSLDGFKDRRVAHLEAHHKKKRIRKKNMKRILKRLAKGGKK